MEGKNFDVAIIGGGVVGCAVLFELTRQGYNCLLLEKNSALLSEASSGNSAMLHTGFDALPGSLELQCIQRCQAHIFPIMDKFNIPYIKCGATLVAWTEEEKQRFPALQKRSKDAGIYDVDMLSPSELLQKEPSLNPVAQGAMFVRGECVIDSNLLGLSFAHHARTEGAQVLTNCKVHGFQGGSLLTDRGSFSAKIAVNCAGLFGDQVDELVGIKTFDILPRKGHYCVLDKSAHQMVHSIIYPIPTEKSKGVLLFKTVYGNTVVGPTAEDVQERCRPPFNADIHHKLIETAKRIVPEWSNQRCVGHYAGVRPATQFKDYQINCYPSRNWITVGGIRSTGVSASLGIGQSVADKLQSEMGVEPSRGHSRQVTLEEQRWRFENYGTSVNIGGQSYATTHPICHFGHMPMENKL